MLPGGDSVHPAKSIHKTNPCSAAHSQRWSRHFENNIVDETAFARLIEFQIENGITGIVPVGTTGESPTLDHDEHIRVIELAVKAARGRCKVIGGTGSNSTEEAIDLTQEAERVGADAALLVAPYYNKPSQEGLFRHFKAIAEATKLPLVLYSIPGRCGIEIGVETVRRLAEACPNIVAIKESGGSIERVNALRAALPEEFDILSGDDFITLAFMAAGARGVVSVASNIVPGEVTRDGAAAAAWKIRRLRSANPRTPLSPLPRFIHRAQPRADQDRAGLGWQNPARKCRLPLCEMSDANAKKLRATFEALGIMKKS